jgi:hypothetical protein
MHLTSVFNCRIISMLLITVLFFSCSNGTLQGVKSYATATFTNRNVYKTQMPLNAKKVYSKEKRPAYIQKSYVITPQNYVGDKEIIPQVKQTDEEIKIEPPAKEGDKSIKTTTTTITTIPPTTKTITIKKEEVAPVSSTIINTKSAMSGDEEYGTRNYIRYKVISDEGNFKYIRLLPGCKFKGDSIIYADEQKPADDPSDNIFSVSKSDLNPTTHYLASSALIGKLITIPFKVRNEYWNDDNKVLQGNFSIGYGFGWKYKLGNHPYRSHYLSTILYAAGISAQKHFSIGWNGQKQKDTTSARTDEFALTYLSFGIAYEFEKFNIGIFCGKDKMFGNLKNWAYQDKWWWGIGIGYELFK